MLEATSLVETARTARPLVSVVIPAYNAAETVDRALLSVFSQTYRPLDVIVVDDASTDHTQVVIEQWAAKCGLHLVSQAGNRGPAAARNLGLLKAQGEYIAFLDADDEWLPDKLEKQVKMLEQNPQASLCCCDDIVVNPDGACTTNSDSKNPANSGADAWRSLLAHSVIATPSVMMRRRHADMVGGFDEGLLVGEDLDYWIRLARLGEVVWVPEPLTRIYKRADGHMSANVLRARSELLPTIRRHLAQCANELSTRERRRIIGSRLAQVGRNLCVNGRWFSGVALIIRGSIDSGNLVGDLHFIAASSLPVRFVRRRRLRRQAG